MKAKLEVNESVIKQALLAHLASMRASKVTLRAQKNEDMYGNAIGHTIFAEVEIDVGDVVAL